MSGPNDGGPAFPIPIAGCTDGGVYNALEQSAGKFGGMTLRDYFAAKAMAAMIGTSAAPALFGLEGADGHCARAAYAIADAMLKAREPQP